MLQKQPEISAQDERNNAESYLRLEKIRLEDKLCVKWDWNISENIRVPSLLLQPLLENAIKYGIEPMDIEEQGTIVVIGKEEADYIEITIANPVSPNRTRKGGNGVTLPNLAERLEWLYPNKHRFRTKSTDEQFEILIRFPKKTLK
jgi:two-component system sensor histidine kinase AlgZ